MQKNELESVNTVLNIQTPVCSHKLDISYLRNASVECTHLACKMINEKVGKKKPIRA